uniref:Putative secreted protein n=1 Tax=Ixodes ricinus TaxID=34613 RepID=A0A6B0U6R5_IXORI
MVNSSDSMLVLFLLIAKSKTHSVALATRSTNLTFNQGIQLEGRSASCRHSGKTDILSKPVITKFTGIGDHFAISAISL